MRQIKVFYCKNCERDFRDTKNKCPYCHQRGKQIGVEAFNTYGKNLPK